MNAMQQTVGKPEAGYVKVDHPWFAHDLMPVYRWTFPKEATDVEFRAAFRAREDWGALAQYAVAWIIDTSSISTAPATQRKAFAAHLERFEDHNMRWNAGSALVVPNAWLHGLVTAAFWISPPKFPNRAFSDPVQAESWAKQQLSAKLAELS